MSLTDYLLDSVATPLAGYSIIEGSRLGLILPVLLLFITLVMFALDFGVVGIGIISSVAMIMFWFMGIVPFPNPISLISFIIIVLITTFRVVR